MTATLPHVWPTVVHMLADAAKRSPGQAAVACAGESLTYAQYAACVSGLAHALREAGAGIGARVILLMGNSIDIAVALFAVQAAGAQVVPLNPDFTGAELAPMIESAAAQAVIYDTAAGLRLAPLLDRFASRFEVGDGCWKFTRWGNDHGLAARLPLPDPAALSMLQFTGGTSGRPKGVDLVHEAVAINVSQREALVPCDAGAERVLAITPLFHIYAIAMGLYLTAYCRGTLVVVPRYRPDVVLEAVQRHGITIMLGSPTIFVGLMAFQDFSKYDLSSLRVCPSGASALPGETLARWESLTGCRIAEGYGQTESGPVLAFNPRHGTSKAGSVGMVAPGTDVQIVDAESGRLVLPAGQLGEIRARGPQIMKGYRGRPAETAEVLRDGWLYTGDVGEFDADGYLYIRDRKKEMVIVGGYNVYPREVEDALTTHPHVLEAAVVGVPDAYRGEALIACVATREPKPDQEALLEHLRTRLVRYKLPSRIVFMDTLPKTGIGKIDKNRIRQHV